MFISFFGYFNPKNGLYIKNNIPRKMYMNTEILGGKLLLHYAVFEELKECVVLLLELGAEHTIKNNVRLRKR